MPCGRTRTAAAVLGTSASQPSMTSMNETPDVHPVRILVVDDHTLFRRGLTALLTRDPRFEVVGDAGDAGEAQRRAPSCSPT